MINSESMNGKAFEELVNRNKILQLNPGNVIKHEKLVLRVHAWAFR